MLEGTAIIIVDEVQRRIREGESPIDAVKHGVSHMALPLFGSTNTTILSFLPIATMPGPSGVFVGTIGSSVILALCCSLALSFTIIPSLSALLSPREPGPPTFWNVGFSNQWMSNLYLKSLKFSFKHPWLTMLLGIAISLPGFLVLPLFQLQFFPSADRNQFSCRNRTGPEASLEETRQTALRVRDLLLEDKLVQRVDWVVGRKRSIVLLQHDRLDSGFAALCPSAGSVAHDAWQQRADSPFAEEAKSSDHDCPSAGTRSGTGTAFRCADRVANLRQ